MRPTQLALFRGIPRLAPQPVWPLDRRLAWTWKKNPAYRTGRHSKTRGRLEAALATHAGLLQNWPRLLAARQRAGGALRAELDRAVQALLAEPLHQVAEAVRGGWYIAKAKIGAARRWVAAAQLVKRLLDQALRLGTRLGAPPTGRPSEEKDLSWETRKRTALDRYRDAGYLQPAGADSS